jgi:cellulose synthase/poly-beta-1,6-N-acetylglucosamine synthase-like glycosyltransferase
MLCTLWLIATAVMQFNLYCHAKKQQQRKKYQLTDHPFVTIQLPVYNEKYVIEDLLHCVARLDYPKEKIEIQVLDDSTDESSITIDRIVEQLQRSQLNIKVLRRNSRNDYKAGALHYGLQHCKGEFVAIFDADFRPSADFLKKLLPHFEDASVGMVQARWAHTNSDENFLTRIQRYLLDLHFNVEQCGRYKAGHFINFCGTAGIWRKQCIEDAGGWDGSILSEDLDLSYRAQIKGWEMVYDDAVIVPAQLPPVVDAFKLQQFRWTKGIAQTARRSLLSVIKMPIPLKKKLHSVFHLMSSFTFVCLFVTAILTIPMLLLRNLYPEFVQLTTYTMVGVLNLALISFMHYKISGRTSGRTEFLRYYPVFIVVYLAMSVQNSIAVLQGLIGKRSAFIRTPKFSNKQQPVDYVSNKINWICIAEMACLLYFLTGIFLSFYLNDYFLLFFFVLMVCGLSVLVFYSIRPIIKVNRKGWKMETKTPVYE